MSKDSTPTSPPDTQAKKLAVRSGEQCPVTGWWQALQAEEQDQTAFSMFVGQGCVMPAVNGANTFWVQSNNARQQTDY